MTGCCRACAAMTFALICSNWAFRSGCFEPSSALRLDWRENPSFTNSLRTVSALIGCPISVSAAASFSMLFDTQIRGSHGIAQRRGLHQALECGNEPRIVLGKCPTPATGAADLPLRQRFRVEIILAAIDRRTGEPGDLRDDCKTTPTRGPHLDRCKQSLPPLVELRADRVPSLPNGIRVDHAIDLRPFSAHRNPSNLSQSDARRRIAIQLLFAVS